MFFEVTVPLAYRQNPGQVRFSRSRLQKDLLLWIQQLLLAVEQAVVGVERDSGLSSIAPWPVTT
jgi:hypothetical protein